MIDAAVRPIFDQEHHQFRDAVRRLIDREIIPNIDRWESAGMVDRSFWTTCGSAGILAPSVPAEYGGLGLDYRFNAIVIEEFSYIGLGLADSLVVHSDIVAEYIVRYGSEAQKRSILPGVLSGETVLAIAMTEPGAGSDLQGIRTSAPRSGDDYVINGSKTYITNGQHADVVVVVTRTNPDAGSKGISLILVEADRTGYHRGRNLDKIGMHSSDTSELFFNDVRVPVDNRLGEEGMGFVYLMTELPQERLSLAIAAQSGALRAFEEAVTFTKNRKAFRARVIDFQNTRFCLADIATQLQVGWAHIDWAIGRHLRRELSTDQASAAKLWHTEMQWRVTDVALQLHGGAGYMNEYPIARFWRDARVQRIYGGTSEIMKLVIGRAL